MRSWPHAPSKIVDHSGIYIVTASTYRRMKLFDTPEKLSLLHDNLLDILELLGWQLQAWAVFSNHYHFVGFSPESGLGLADFTTPLHRNTARELNRIDQTPGRQVWYRCWDTRLTFEKSYLARLAYVHNNPVKHGLVGDACDYQWCSAKMVQESG